MWWCTIVIKTVQSLHSPSFLSQMLLLSLLSVLLLLAVCRWYVRRRLLPPGPPAVPVLGSIPFLDLRRGLVSWTTDTRVTGHTLATVSMGPKNYFVINDLKLARELFEKEEFTGRPRDQWGEKFKVVKGVMRGIVHTEGHNWVKQRRFGLKTLRDLGFGNRSVEQIINEEIDEICTKLSRSSERGEEHLLGSDFNIPLINVLWQLVAGYRFDQQEPEGRDVINNINEFFRNYQTLFTIPLLVIKVFRKKFFEENMKIATNQTKYILGKLCISWKRSSSIADW